MKNFFVEAAEIIKKEDDLKEIILGEKALQEWAPVTNGFISINTPCPGEKALQELRGKKKKVAILGFAPYSLDETPWNNEEFEFWGLNELYLKIPPKFTRWFEIHHRSIIERTRRDHNHLEWLQQAKIPIYMQDHYDDIPYSVKYPRDEMFQKFRPYFTNSVAWMLAIAINEGFEEIHVYGVDMAVEGEFSWERPSCEYFLGVAEGRGIKVYIPRQSDLLKAQYYYGYEDQQAAMDKADARIIDFNKQLDGLHINFDEHLMRLYSGMDKIPVFSDTKNFVVKKEDVAKLSAEQQKFIAELAGDEKTQADRIVGSVQRMQDVVKNQKMLLLEINAIQKIQAKLNGAIEDTNYNKRIWSI